MGLTSRQLRYFVTVAETGQISAAAKELFIAQSAVTVAIQEIERQLKQPVFLRTSRGVRLTPAGNELLPKAREILRMLQEASEVTGTGADLQGVVRVGVTYTVMGYFLPQHLQRLIAQYPHLEISWSEMDRAQAERMLTRGELDLALVLTSNIQSPEVMCESFVHSARRLWMAPMHPLAKLQEIRFSDVAQYPYVLLTVDEADQTTRTYWKEERLNVLLETRSIEAVRSIVANGNAVSILSDMVYRPWSLEGKRIDTAILSEEVPDMRIGLAWRRGSEFSRPMKAVYEYFRDQFDIPGSRS